MRDGSDAIADWPILNALLNVAAGATWVSVHHGGGVGIGNSIHAGMVVVADGTAEAARAARARAHGRSRDGRDASRRRRLRRGARSRPSARARPCRSILRGASDVRGERLTAAARPRPRPARDAGGTAAPLRGSRLGEVEVDRGRVRPLRGRADRGGRARCATSPPLDGRRRGARRPRPLRDPRPRRLPHARVLRRRPRRRVRAARAAARPTRSCTPRAAGSSRPSGRRARPARRRSRDAVAAAPRLDAPGTARPRSRRSRATGSIARPSSRRCARSARPAAFRPGSAPTPCRRSSTTPTRTSTSCSRRCCPRRRSSPRPPTSSSSAALSTPTQARRYLEACRDAGPRAAAARRPVHGGGRDPARDRARRALRRPPRGDGAGGRRARSPRATSTGVLLPASALFLDRPMPPARALVDAGAAVALATDFNPGSAFCESLPLVCSLACTQLRLSPAEALAACTVNAAHVLGRADRQGAARARLRRRPRLARRAGLAVPRLPPRRRHRRTR